MKDVLIGVLAHNEVHGVRDSESQMIKTQLTLLLGLVEGKVSSTAELQCRRQRIDSVRLRDLREQQVDSSGG